MNRILAVCVAGLALTAGVVAANTGAAQTLQQGISVVMVPAANAAPMPEADNPDAWVVTVRRDSALHFGTEMVTAEGLLDKMTRTPRRRDAKLYIKADARAPFANVQKILQAGRMVGFEAPVLLTAQSGQAAPGAIVPPRGLEVLVGAPSSTEAVVVQMSGSSQPSPRLTINNADVSDGALPGTLKRMLQSRSERVVVLKADGQLPFGQVVRVIDACHGAGARVAVATPEL